MYLQGKPRELQADDDAKAAALEWASQAAFGNTEVAAPKILGDIVESLVGAVYIDSHQNFEKTWEVSCSAPHDHLIAQGMLGVAASQLWLLFSSTGSLLCSQRRWCAPMQ